MHGALSMPRSSSAPVSLESVNWPAGTYLLRPFIQVRIPSAKGISSATQSRRLVSPSAQQVIVRERIEMLVRRHWVLGIIVTTSSAQQWGVGQIIFQRA